jgi:exodeoxyribonuclease V beta subunit
MALPLNLPLRGSQLIEASAGTGKTFTIALLYVRLVLGHGAPDNAAQPRDNGYHRPLIPPEILVVTFTEAATQELRMRIRDRLVEAAGAFREAAGEADLQSGDPLLALRNEYDPALWPACARRLQVAAEWMDESAVSTIHSWAYRMLKEHAFDSGNLFRQELVADQSDLLRDAVNDYWRNRFYPLEESAAGVVHAAFASPSVLQHALAPLLKREDAQLVHAGLPPDPAELDRCLQAAAATRAACQQAEDDARAAYRADADGVSDLLGELRPGMHGNTYRGVNDDSTFAGWLDELDAWGHGRVQTSGFVEKLAPGRIKLKNNYSPPEHPFFERLETWQQTSAAQSEQEQQLRPLILADARVWVRQRLEQQLAERSEMGFDELLKRLDAALHGPKGETLAHRVRTQFPVALIDEFQDTDPVQYRIFDRIYRAAENDQSCCLVLIGDPKQAIYGFRGADIHTYLQARRATTGRHHTLQQNFRSSRAMVQAVNRVFSRAESFLRGAFRFREGSANPVPFTAVDAQGRAEQLVLDDAPATALTTWLYREQDTIGTTPFRVLMAEHAAERIACWLNQGHRQQAGFIDNGEFRPLVPGDIAVLVRDHKEAGAIRNAMSRRGLASVYLSDRDSVFRSEEATDVLAWLKACAEPDDDGMLRAALATRSMALPLAALDRLRQDELAWEAYQERFYEYRQQWSRLGALPMLRCLMQDFDVAGKLLAQPEGERRMTNLLHLAEWAQQAGDAQDGPQALIRLLAEHIRDPAGEEQILRLESDAALVQVVTIHKSKGLEYPLVVLPFACSWREAGGRETGALYHDDGMRLEVADRKQAAEAYEKADDERLSEDVRLLYVALTRARHATFIGLAPLAPGRSKKAQLHKGAAGYLLAGGEEIPDADTLTCYLGTLQQGCADIAVSPVHPLMGVSRYQPEASQNRFRPARRPEHAPFEPWWVASYSALDTRATAPAGEPESARQDTRSEEARELEKALKTGHAPGTGLPAAGTIHAFPRGPEPGTFLHGLLEWAGEQGFSRAGELPERLQVIERRCLARSWQSHAPAVNDWLDAMLKCPLTEANGGTPLRLAGLNRYQVEREFWFAVTRADASRLDALIQAHILPGRPRPALAPHQLNGLLKGFIDLVAEHQGRYYVIDWKSNYLGPNDSHYTAATMEQALLEKRYDVQLGLYLLALHRHLAQRLGTDYDYDREVGGALFVFLRGVQASGHGVLQLLPSRAFIEELDALLGARTTREAC